MVVKLSPFGGENYGKMVIFVLKKYVKMLKSKTFYLLKFRLTWPIEQVRT